MAKDDRSRQRAYFARTKRLAQEAGRTNEKRTAQTHSAVRTPRQQAKSRAGEARPKLARAAKQSNTQNAARSGSRAAEARRMEAQRRDRLQTQFRAAARTKEQAMAAQRVRDAGTRRMAQQRKDDARKAFNRELDRKRATAQKTAQKHQQKRSADIRARSVAFVVNRQRQHAGDQVREHRRQTDQLRTRHRAEMQSHRENGNVAIDRHAGRIRAIDNAERRDLDQLAARSRTIGGRLAGIVRPGEHARQATAITARHEASRMKAHRDLEALKERQFGAVQTARLKQAQERKAIFERHRVERRDLATAQAKDRPRQLEQHRQAFTRAAAREQHQARTQEQGLVRTRAPEHARPR